MKITTKQFFRLCELFESNRNTFHYQFLLLFGCYILLSPLLCQGQDLDRILQISGASDVIGNAVAVDNEGNVYAMGYFENTATFGEPGQSLSLTSAGSQDIFITKSAPSGEVLWAKRIGGESADLGADIAVDQDANVYITGSYIDTLSFASPSVPDLFGESIGNILVLKMDTDGEVIWAKGFLGPSSSIGNSIAVDADGNVVTTGRLKSTMDFDPGPGEFPLTSQGIDDVFVSKLDSEGNFVWAKAFLGTESNIGRGIAVDQAGNVYTTGGFNGLADFDPGAGTFELNTVSGDAVFISKLNAQGEFVWAKKMAGGGTEGLDIQLDGDGNIHTCGRFSNLQDFDPGPDQFVLESDGSYDGFISKLDNDGEFLWATRFGGPFAETGISLDVDEMGNVYTTGFFYDEFSLSLESGEENIISAGDRDIFLAKISPDGEFEWAFGMGGAERDEGSGIAVDANGSVYTIGGFEETADFGSSSLTATGETDAFITVHNQVTNTSDLRPHFEPLVVYPNPAQDQLQLRWNGDVRAGIVEIIDMRGKIVSTQTAGTNPYLTDANQLAPGLYFVRISAMDSDRVFLGKLIVK